jgi:hypothetical protein
MRIAIYLALLLLAGVVVCWALGVIGPPWKG